MGSWCPEAQAVNKIRSSAATPLIWVGRGVGGCAPPLASPDQMSAPVEPRGRHQGNLAVVKVTTIGLMT